MFKFTCPKVESQPEIFRSCKLCHSSHVIIHQRFKQQIKDSVVDSVEIIRLKCKVCKYSFRIYPEGIKDYTLRSKRLIFLGVILYSAGLSYEKSCGFLAGMLGRNLESLVTIWRDVQNVGEKLRRRQMVSPRLKRATLVVGLDGTYVKIKGKKQPIMVAVDSKDGTIITVDLLDEWQEKELKIFFQDVAKVLGLKNIAGLITDDLDTYKLVSSKYQKPHQVCLGHVKKNLANRLDKLDKEIPKDYLDKLSGILDPPKEENQQVLMDLLRDPKLWRKGRRHKHWVKLREIVTDLLRNWDYYIAFLKYQDLPITNNQTEQSIGRSKVRYKLTRGFKSKMGALNFFYLTQNTGMHKFESIANSC